MAKPNIKIKKKSIKSVGRPQPKANVKEPSNTNTLQVQDQFQQLVQVSSEPMLIATASGEVRFINAAFCLLTGHEPNKIIGWPLQNLCATDLATLYPQNGNFPDPLPTTLNIEISSADSKVHWAEITPSLVLWENGQAMLWVFNRNTIKNQVREQYQTKLFTNLHVASEAAMELLSCKSLGELYKRAVEIPREKLGLERVSLSITSADTLISTYNMDAEYNTINEMGIQSDLPRHYYDGLRSSNPDDPRYGIRVLDQGYYDDEDNFVQLGRGWVAITPVWGTDPQRPIAFLFNDTAISQTPPDPAQQQILVYYSTLLSTILMSKTLETEHSESERRFEFMINTMDEVFWVTNPEGSAIHYVSPAFERYWDVERTSLYEDSSLWLAPLNEDERKRVAQEFEEHAHLGTFDVEYQMEVPNLGLRWMRDRGNPVFDNDGNVEYIVGIAEDVTERKIEGIDRQKAEKRYRTLLETLPTVTYNIDLRTDGDPPFISPQIEKLTGYTQDEWTADLEIAQRIVVDEDRPRVVAEIKRAHLDGDGYDMEYRILNKKNEIRWVKDQSTFWTEEDGSLSLIQGIMIDITGEKELQREMLRTRRLESIGSLAGGVAHDLNNLLGPMVGYPDIMLETLDADDPMRKDLIAIKKSAERSSEVIKDLLALSRQSTVSLIPVDFRKVLLEYLSSPSIKDVSGRHEKVSMSLKILPEAIHILGSAPQLTQVIMNLVINAFEACEKEGEVEVFLDKVLVNETIDGFEVIEPGYYAVFKVTDNGYGLLPDDVEHIFEPFFSRKELGQSGSGLGLAVVYAIIKDFYGYIDVSSVPGRGATFSVYLPMTEQRQEAQVEDEKVHKGHENILVIDDVEEQRDLASRILEQQGYTVKTLPHGENAVAELKKFPAEVVLLDMILGDSMDGLDVYNEIHKHFPDIQCILVSGYSKTERAKRALKSGARTYLRKPYTMKALTRTVRETLDGLDPTE